MLNPKGLHWSIGGLGVWWPGRTQKATDVEEKVVNSEQRKEGLMMWTVFNLITLKQAHTMRNHHNPCGHAGTMVDPHGGGQRRHGWQRAEYNIAPAAKREGEAPK